MKSRLDEVKDQLCVDLVDHLLQNTSKTHTRGQGIVRAQEGINALLDEIDELQRNAVSNAEISDQRLNEIAMAASELAFSSSTGEFPIQLFDKIIYDSTSRESFTLVISKQRKGEFTDVEMSQRASNEGEFYAKIVANHVGAILLSDVVRQCEIRDVIAPDANLYWKTLKDEACHLREQGLTPLLILDNPANPDWMWEWQYPEIDGAYPRPADLAIRREKDGRGKSYICDLNNIQIFSGSVVPGESLLVARETFSSIAFKEYKPSVFVKVETTEVPGSETLVDLRLTFERAVAVKFPYIVRIRHELSTAKTAEI
ncbi:MAG: hypothetical protein E6Q59_07310 [Nitrosomonas sp.]|nr:MAG: hypothetical protein E6Q59_07310 [Nitrosomonas sp.]